MKRLRNDLELAAAGQAHLGAGIVARYLFRVLNAIGTDPGLVTQPASPSQPQQPEEQSFDGELLQLELVSCIELL